MDVVALLARTGRDRATRLYLKFPSAVAVYLLELCALYPVARWVFVYYEAASLRGDRRLKFPL